MNNATITTEIYEKLVEIMETLKGDDQPFVEVYGYNSPETPSYPIACVDIINGGIQEDSSAFTKTLTNNFSISCIFLQGKSENSLKLIMKVLGLVYAKFTEEGIADTLGGTTERMNIQHQLLIGSDGDKPLYILQFLVDTYNVMSIN